MSASDKVYRAFSSGNTFRGRIAEILSRRTVLYANESSLSLGKSCKLTAEDEIGKLLEDKNLLVAF